ncbi:MAG TPA: hypothetical protein VFC50_00195 [Candidatus Dormibacteraeota bacterium]|nr:hypothetical protein [Candidatus Dormibacteraeota bacterium]
MTTTDTVLLIILTSLLSLFFLLCIALVISLLKLLSGVRRVIERAESVVDSVESAAEVLKDTQGRLALFKLIRNIIKLTQKRSDKK